jgi:hypothetical protein
MLEGCYSKVISSYKTAKEGDGENFIVIKDAKKIKVADVVVKNGNSIKEIKGPESGNTISFEDVTAFQNENGFFKRLYLSSKMVYDYTEKSYYGPQGFVIRTEKGALNIYSESVRDFINDDFTKFSKAYTINYYVEEPLTGNVAVLTKQNVTKFVWEYIESMLNKSETAKKIMDDYRNSAKGQRTLKEVYQETDICIKAVKKYNEEVRNGLIK